MDEKYTSLYGETYLEWAAKRDGFDPKKILRDRRKQAAIAPPQGGDPNESTQQEDPEEDGDGGPAD